MDPDARFAYTRAMSAAEKADYIETTETATYVVFEAEATADAAHDEVKLRLYELRPDYVTGRRS